MPALSDRRVLLAGLLVLVLLGVGAVLVLPKEAPTPSLEALPEVAETPTTEVIGYSVERRAIEAYSYGTGDTLLLFVGGIHGGYEWNSVLLAYRFIDYLEATPEAVPEGIRVAVIPNLNPDAVFDVVGREGRFDVASVPAGDKSAARFNANGVDLNRNFDCKWQSQSSWRGTIVSAGTAPFSEPEAAALRDYVLQERPAAVVFWHSQSNAVYASECEEGILAGTRVAMNAYAKAAGYPAVDVFDAYPITGDAEGWLASIGVPAITVELSTHESIEWEKNLAGAKALINSY